MILRPEPPLAPRDAVASVWEAVARTQRAEAVEYGLIRQPDHARLAAELARHFAFEGLPPLNDEIIMGISLHDEGWAAFDSGAEKLQATAARYKDGVPSSAGGRPLSFLDIKAGDFLRAWRASIEAAEAVAPIAGLIVSGHFYRLGQFGIGAGHYSADDAQLVCEFVDQEQRRREGLINLERRSPEEVEYWTDVLQFCDLLSLYLCCGSLEKVEFPQRIVAPDRAVSLRYEEGAYRISPSLFASAAMFGIEVHDTRGDGSRTVQLSFR